MKKALFSIVFIVFALFVLTNRSFAELNNSTLNSMANDVKNAVGGAENAMEGAAKSATDTAKNGMNNMKDSMNNMKNNVQDSAEKTGNSIKNGAENLGNTMKNGVNNMTNNQDYTASRTSADGGQTTNTFMNAETWSWIIIGVVAIAIIALFWYYAARSKNDHTKMH